MISEDSDKTAQMGRLICHCWLHKSYCRFCYALAQIFYFSMKANGVGTH